VARIKYESLAHELQARGFLTLSKAINWLRAYHPESAISYPTALRMIAAEKLLSVKVGGQHRLSGRELARFVEHGNSAPDNQPSNEPEEDFSDERGNYDGVDTDVDDADTDEA
jgi:hypothetical protein